MNTNMTSLSLSQGEFSIRSPQFSQCHSYLLYSFIKQKFVVSIRCACLYWFSHSTSPVSQSPTCWQNAHNWSFQFISLSPHPTGKVEDKISQDVESEELVLLTRHTLSCNSLQMGVERVETITQRSDLKKSSSKC